MYNMMMKHIYFSYIIITYIMIENTNSIQLEFSLVGLLVFCLVCDYTSNSDMYILAELCAMYISLYLY